MNVVTGGNGYVGYALVKELASRGEDIRLLLRHANKTYFEDLNCEIIRGDICYPQDLDRAFAGADTVYHVAGVVDISGTKNDLVWRVNYEGTKNVVEACKRNGVKTLVYFSSVDAIHVTPDMDIIREVSHFEPDELEGEYAKSKASATQYVIDSADENLKCCVVHPSACIGPGDISGSSSIVTMIKLFLKGLFRVSLGFGAYNFVDVRDVAKGAIAAAEKGRNGECYILSGTVLSVDEFIAALNVICGKKPPKVKVKKGAVQMMVPMISKGFSMAKLPPVLNDYSIRKLCENCNFSHGKATAELGYRPMDIMQSLEDTINYIKEEQM